MGTAIHIDNLSKTYGRGEQMVHAVKGLSFAVDTQQVFGFLGPNGAGKTTTIRMMLDLIRPTDGKIYLFDKPSSEADFIRQTRVGALVEEATAYPAMTARDNLQTLLYLNSDLPEKRIDEVLDLVGLSEYATRKVKTFSTGMKQRLGVAATLLHDPDLIILDEPTSGLDPKGIQDMRQMFRYLVDEKKKTVFLSSHLLHEVEQTCDSVAIIRKGELVREGTVKALVADTGQVSITASPLDKAQAILADVYSTIISNDKLLVTAQQDAIPDIIAMLVQADIAIYEVHRQSQTLEDLFLEVTDD